MTTGIACLLSLAVVSPASAQRTDRVQGQEAVAGEIIVRFRSLNLAQSQALAGQDADIVSSEPVGGTGGLLLRSRARSVAALLASYGGRPDVAYAEPNYILHTSDVANDAYFDLQYALRNTGQTIEGQAGIAGADIKAAEAWGRTEGSRSIVVGIIDTGVTYNHPDLAPNLWSAPFPFLVTVSGQSIICDTGAHGFNAITRTCDPADDAFNNSYHGTHVSGIIGASGNNGTGVSGVSPAVSLLALKAFDSDGHGSISDCITAIEFAIQLKSNFGGPMGNIRILNASWGAQGPAAFSQALFDEINLANTKDMLFIAGAGNNATNNDNSPFYPASYNLPNVLSVAATDNRDTLAFFSNYGAGSVHLGAPGVDVLSTYPPDQYVFSSGTSMATPMVSGAAALVLSTCSLTTAALKATLLTSIDTVPALNEKTVSGGRLNVFKAISNCAPAVPAQFTLTATPGTSSVAPGVAAIVTVAVNSVGGFSGSVNLGANLPPGMTASFSPASINGGSGISTLTVFTTGLTPGNYAVAITGTSSSNSRTSTVRVTVGPPVIQSIQPRYGVAGMISTAVINGIGLDGVTAVTFSGSGMTSTILMRSAAQESLPIELAIDSAAPSGLQTFSVTSPIGTSAPFDGFTVIHPSPISVGQTVNGTLSPTDPLDPFSSGDRYADYYVLTLTSTTDITVDMRSTVLNSFLRVLSPSATTKALDDNDGGGIDSHIAITLSAGTYFIDATSGNSGETGAYTLSINVLPALTSLTPVFATIGTPLNVTLTGNRFSLPMTVSGGAGVNVSNVSVLSSTSATATLNVAVAGASTRSVTVTTSAGTSNPARIWVYPTIPSIFFGTPVSGALDINDGRDPYSSTAYADMYKLTLLEDTNVKINMTSTFQPYIKVYSASTSGSFLIAIPAGSGSTILAGGTYYISASSSQGGMTGDYTLSVNALPLLTYIAPTFGATGTTVDVLVAGTRLTPGMTLNAGSRITVSNVSPFSTFKLATATFNITTSAPVGLHGVTASTSVGTGNSILFAVFPVITPINVGQSLTGTLDTTDGKDPVSYTNRYADLFELTLPASVELAIFVQSTNFQPDVYLLSEVGAPLTVGNKIGSSTSSQIITTLSAGKYYISASSVLSGATGNYTLSVSIWKKARGQITSQ